MMDVVYENNLGERLNLTEWPYMIQSESLYDYAWKYETTNTAKNGGYITAFFRDVTEISFNMLIHARSNKEFAEAMRKFHDHVEVDVRMQKSGRLIVNNTEYLLCYIISSNKTLWSGGIRTALEGIKIASEKPLWCKDIFKHYRQVGTPGGEDYLDMPHDCPYDLAPGGYGNIINNDYVSDCDFLMKIYAPVTNPEVYIAGHLYKVHQRLEDKEYILIDSREKTVYLYDEFGNGTNIFNLRDKENNVFQLIPAGRSEIETNTQIDLTVYQERSEPKWIL